MSNYSRPPITNNNNCQLRWQQDNIDWFRQNAPDLLGEDDYDDAWDWRMPSAQQPELRYDRPHTWAEKGKGPSDEELQLLKQEEEEARREAQGFGVVPVIRTSDPSPPLPHTHASVWTTAANDFRTKLRREQDEKEAMLRKMWASCGGQGMLERCNPFNIHHDTMMMDVDRAVPQAIDELRVEELDTRPLPLVCDKENDASAQFCLPDAALQEAEYPDLDNFRWTEEDERRTQEVEALSAYRAMDDEIFAKVLAVRDQLCVGFEISDQEIADAILDNDGSVQGAACWITFQFRPKSQAPASSPPVKSRPPVWNTRPEDDFEKLYWL